MRILYQCEICKRTYSSKEEAIECESQKAREYPIGTIFGLGCDNIVFAVIKNNFISYPHSNYISFYACRDNGYGDNVSEYCGDFLHLNDLNKPVKDIPAFTRMVEALKKQGIEPRIWTGYKSIKLKG